MTSLLEEVRLRRGASCTEFVVDVVCVTDISNSVLARTLGSVIEAQRDLKKILDTVARGCPS